MKGLGSPDAPSSKSTLAPYIHLYKIMIHANQRNAVKFQALNTKYSAVPLNIKVISYSELKKPNL